MKSTLLKHIVWLIIACACFIFTFSYLAKLLTEDVYTGQKNPVCINNCICGFDTRDESIKNQKQSLGNKDAHNDSSYRMYEQFQASAGAPLDLIPDNETLKRLQSPYNVLVLLVNFLLIGIIVKIGKEVSDKLWKILK